MLKLLSFLREFMILICKFFALGQTCLLCLQDKRIRALHNFIMFINQLLFVFLWLCFVFYLKRNFFTFYWNFLLMLKESLQFNLKANIVINENGIAHEFTAMKQAMSRAVCAMSLKWQKRKNRTLNQDLWKCISYREHLTFPFLSTQANFSQFS